MNLYPITFTPYYIEKIWGGQKIKSILKRDTRGQKIGEVIEICGLDECESVVNNGKLKGQRISKLFTSDIAGEYVVNKYLKFPLIIKYLDASENISIQVHPSRGKSKDELWYFINKPDKELICGIEKEFDINKVINFKKTIQVENGDFVYIPSGALHCLTKGSFVLEIQEAINVTYRIYDWNRKNNEKRELHLEKALKHIISNYNENDFKKFLKLKSENKNYKIFEVFGLTKFNVEKIEIKDAYKTTSLIKSFSILNIVSGSIEISCEAGCFNFNLGTTVLIPAKLGDFIIKGNSTIIHTYMEEKNI